MFIKMERLIEHENMAEVWSSLSSRLVWKLDEQLLWLQNISFWVNYILNYLHCKCNSLCVMFVNGCLNDFCKYQPLYKCKTYINCNDFLEISRVKHKLMMKTVYAVMLWKWIVQWPPSIIKNLIVTGSILSSLCCEDIHIMYNDIFTVHTK